MALVCLTPFVCVWGTYQLFESFYTYSFVGVCDPCASEVREQIFRCSNSSDGLFKCTSEGRSSGTIDVRAGALCFVAGVVSLLLTVPVVLVAIAIMARRLNAPRLYNHIQQKWPGVFRIGQAGLDLPGQLNRTETLAPNFAEFQEAYQLQRLADQQNEHVVGIAAATPEEQAPAPAIMERPEVDGNDNDEL